MVDGVGVASYGDLVSLLGLVTYVMLCTVLTCFHLDWQQLSFHKACLGKVLSQVMKAHWSSNIPVEHWCTFLAMGQWSSAWVGLGEIHVALHPSFLW